MWLVLLVVFGCLVLFGLSDEGVGLFLLGLVFFVGVFLVLGLVMVVVDMVCCVGM